MKVEQMREKVKQKSGQHSTVDHRHLKTKLICLILLMIGLSVINVGRRVDALLTRCLAAGDRKWCNLKRHQISALCLAASF